MGDRSASVLLTAREREVASLVGLGLTNRQIGAELGISERTVGAHVQNILNKLGANNRVQIATWSAKSSQSLAPSDGALPAVVTRPAISPVASPMGDRVRRPFLTIVAVGLAGLLIWSDKDIGIWPAGTRTPVAHGDLAYQAQLDGSGTGFSIRYSLGDPDASAIRFVKEPLSTPC